VRDWQQQAGRELARCEGSPCLDGGGGVAQQRALCLLSNAQLDRRHLHGSKCCRHRCMHKTIRPWGGRGRGKRQQQMAAAIGSTSSNLAAPLPVVEAALPW
jgi:hypothetical protein